MGGVIIGRVGLRRVLAWTLSLVFFAMPVAAQPPSADPPPVNPYSANGAIPGSGAGLTIGYLAGDGDDATLGLIAKGVHEEAAIAGVVLAACDSGVARRDPLACARALRRAGVDGVIAGHLDPGIAAAVCAAYGNVPTITLGRSAAPCAVASATADDHAEGWQAGERVGAAVADERACAFDLVATLSGPTGDDASGDRLVGLIEGFASACGPIPESRLQRLGDASGDGSVGSQVSALLAVIPSNGLAVLLSDADEPALEALAAAEAAGRADAVRIGAIGGTSDAWQAIGCHPSWVADATSFPERYGRTLVPAIVDLLTGQDVPTLMTFPVAVLDRETIRSHYPDVPAC